MDIRMCGTNVAGVRANGDGLVPRAPLMHLDTRLWVAEALASWTVRRAFEVGYRGVTGRDLPTARDSTVPMRQVLLWTAATAVSVAVADAVVDRLVLRREPAQPPLVGVLPQTDTDAGR